MTCEQRQTALGDACTSAANAVEALARVRDKVVQAGLLPSVVDVLLDDARRLSAALGDEYIRREAQR